MTYDICWRDGQGFSVEVGPQGAEGAQRAGGHAQGGVLRLHQARTDRRGRAAFHRGGVRRGLARRDRCGGPGDEGRALPPLLRQAGPLRGRLRAGRERRLEADPEGAEGPEGPLGQGAGRAAGVPRGRAGAGLPQDRHPGRSRGARLRALPRAGGALDLRQRARHRAVGARGRQVAARRADAADLRPDLLRRDVVGRRVRRDRGRPRGGRRARRGRDRLPALRRADDGGERPRAPDDARGRARPRRRRLLAAVGRPLALSRPTCRR